MWNMSLTTVMESASSRMRRDEKWGHVVYRATLDVTGATEVAATVGSGHSFTVDEPASFGGGDAGPGPVEYALAALGSCQAITYQFWAAHLGVTVDTIHIVVEGDLDLRGFFGVREGVRPGLGAVRVNVAVSGPESPQRYEELAAAVDEHCPVLDIFTGTVAVERTLTVS
ncbi:MAG: hypothetical protein QOF30_419 [Acidimicrobiaceae bacterium]|nr:hypothetical protein [Acidimicrobiaceae bacterium]